MKSPTFDRETLLDLVVNAVPLGIMLFFLVVFAAYNPFGPNAVNTALQFSIVGVTLVALVVLTYYSARAIADAEADMERRGVDVGPGGTRVPEETHD